MILTIDIKDSVADKILYFLESLKKDVKIVKDDSISSILAIEEISKNEKDYEILLKSRQERIVHPENYGSLDDIDWD